MSDVPKAREELDKLVQLLQKRDLPKDYVVKVLRYIMLFMFKEKEPPNDLASPVLASFLDDVKTTEVKLVFNRLSKEDMNERDIKFVKDLYKDFEVYGRLTTGQWQALLMIKKKYEHDLGVM